MVEGPARLPTAGLPAPPSFAAWLFLLSGQLAFAWGTAGSIRAARNATPERSFIVQG
jgi:hypothetical protein